MQLRVRFLISSETTDTSQRSFGLDLGVILLDSLARKGQDIDPLRSKL